MGEDGQGGADADAPELAPRGGVQIPVGEEQRPQKKPQAHQIAEIKGIPGSGVMDRGHGIEQTQGESQARLPVPPEKVIQQKSIDAGTQAIDQNQERVMFSGNFHQAIVKQVKKGEPLFAIRGDEILSERMLRHLDEGGPIIQNIKENRSPEDYYRHRQQEEQHQERVKLHRRRF